MKIPMLDLKLEYEYMKADIDAAIARCLEHQHWILGPEVKEFEDKVSDYLGVKYCIGTSSGTDALVLALRALAIKTKGQEYFDRSDLIITTPFTFTATGDAILRAGATPFFVDIDPITYNLDPNQIREYLTQNSKLKTQNSTHVVGVVPVHLYGQSCQVDKIMSIASEHSLFVVEDCAQAFGAARGGKRLGAIGDAGAFSFFPSKNLGGFGDAGMVSTNDDELADLIRMLIKHGGKDKYNVDHVGYNARMDTLQAAVLLAKLPYIDEFNSRRQRIASIYNEGLKDLPGLILPLALSHLPQAGVDSPIAHSPSPAFAHVYHQYTLRVLSGSSSLAPRPSPLANSFSSTNRDTLQRYLKDAGIDSMVYYPVPLHKMKVFGGRCMVYDELMEAEKGAQEVLSLPIEPLQSEDVILHIAETTKEFFI